MSSYLPFTSSAVSGESYEYRGQKNWNNLDERVTGKNPRKVKCENIPVRNIKGEGGLYAAAQNYSKSW